MVLWRASYPNYWHPRLEGGKLPSEHPVGQNFGLASPESPLSTGWTTAEHFPRTRIRTVKVKSSVRPFSVNLVTCLQLPRSPVIGPESNPRYFYPNFERSVLERHQRQGAVPLAGQS